MKLKRFTFTLLTCCIAIVFGPKAAVEAASLSVIADGLDNARALNFGPDGNLYVAETGLGGDGSCVNSPSALNQPICTGDTGAITKITSDGKQDRVITNLPSLALQPSQTEGAGPQELDFDSSGNPYLLVGFAGTPASRDANLNAAAGNLLPADGLLNSPDLGQLYKFESNTNSWTSIADFAKYELENNPDGGDVITNPYAVAIEGNTAYVVDAGANVFYTLGLDGSNLQATPLPTQTINNPVFPPFEPGQVLPPGAPSPDQLPEQIELQSVPTGVAIGPDGAAYVSEFTGFPYPEGEARVFRIENGKDPEVFANGFTQIGDLAFDKNGNLLVLQYGDQPYWDPEQILPASLIQVAPDGSRTTLVAAGEGLESATAITVGSDNAIYVTNKGASPGEGQVVRIDDVESVPEPSSMFGLLAFGALGGGTWLKRKRKQQADVVANS